MYRIIIISILFLFGIQGLSHGQQDRRHVRQGNELYKEEQYNRAEIRYRQSLEENPQNIKGMFNLGNSLYRQGRYEEAAELFEGLSKFAPGEDEKAYAYHNLGNTFLQSQQYAESIEAYKNALRINPEDEETRFNLTYAMRMLKEQPPQDQQGEDQDNQDEGQEQNQSQEQQENNPNQNPLNEQNQHQSRPDQLSPQDAQRILDALNQKEQKVQEDLKREQTPRSRVRQEREW